MKRLVPILLMHLAVTGCKREVPLVPADRIYTVEEYLAHPDLRLRVSAACSNDPGRIGRDPNCVNVHRADRVASAGNASGMPRAVP
ncbi:EexN family lipoprotein [Massilia sp. DD77]|uniref:EexN family lipoprotein n=1 Tax=Massilia sp. DD77 TaxID=3109349 RepID=UPI0030001E87